MSDETARKEAQKQKERKKLEHLRYLQKKYGRPLTAHELRLVKQGRL
jgi:hypothetical protein